MQHDITKLCADSLRSFLNDTHGLKLKSGHAHEIVAAFLGYKSKISLLADETYSLARLDEAEFILLDPPINFVDQRIKNLDGISPDLPPGYILAESIYSAIIRNNALLEKIQPNFQELALAFAKERLQQHIGHWRMNRAPQWIIRVRASTTDTSALFAVSFDVPATDGKRSRYSKINIQFPRISGNIGYGLPDIMPAFYSGQFRDPDYNPDFDIKSGERP